MFVVLHWWRYTPWWKRKKEEIELALRRLKEREVLVLLLIVGDKELVYTTRLHHLIVFVIYLAPQLRMDLLLQHLLHQLHALGWHSLHLLIFTLIFSLMSFVSPKQKYILFDFWLFMIGFASCPCLRPKEVFMHAKSENEEELKDTTYLIHIFRWTFIWITSSEPKWNKIDL